MSPIFNFGVNRYFIFEIRLVVLWKFQFDEIAEQYLCNHYLSDDSSQWRQHKTFSVVEGFYINIFLLRIFFLGPSNHKTGLKNKKITQADELIFMLI